MKQQQNFMTEQQCRQICTLTAVAAVLLAICRTVLTPIAFDQPVPYGIVLGVTGALSAVLLTLCALKSAPPITVGGRTARVSAAGAAVLGATMLIVSFTTAHEWLAFGLLPYPSKSIPGGADVLFVYLLIFTGLAAAAFFLLLAVIWWRARACKRRFMPLLALAPVLWSWVRLIRYITSHTSSLGLFRNVYDLGTIVFEILFFVVFARYVSGIEEKPSRFFFGISLCAGLLCTISGVTQAALFLVQDQTAFETCVLVAAPDFGVALFAFLIAFAQGFGTACDEEDEELPAEQPNEEDDDGAEYLISDLWFSMPDSQEEQSDS